MASTRVDGCGRPSMDQTFRDLRRRLEEFPSGFSDLCEGITLAMQLSELDPEAALFRLRKVLESIVTPLFEERVGTPAGTQPLEGLIQRLIKDRHLPRRVAVHANTVRELGNVGVHDQNSQVERHDVAHSIQHLIEVIAWYDR